MNEEIRQLISQADKAIQEERFDDLMNFYSEDAVLVVKPGLEVQGKENIKQAFIKIAAYFKNSIVPTQGKMMMIEAGDTVLVLFQCLIIQFAISIPQSQRTINQPSASDIFRIVLQYIQ